MWGFEGDISIYMGCNSHLWLFGVLNNYLPFLWILNGSVSIKKDDDNFLKFSYVALGCGRSDIKVNVSDLSNKEDHHIAVTWDLKNKQTKLYMDGKIKAGSSVEWSIKLVLLIVNIFS